MTSDDVREPLDSAGLSTVEERAAVFAALGDPHRLAIVDALALTDLTPSDLAAATDMPSNLLAHHLRLLADAGLVVTSRSEGDGRRRYVALVPDSLQRVLGRGPSLSGRFAFVCTHNSARSQFAAARFEQLTGEPSSSAGTHPASSVHPAAVEVARTYGLDLSVRVPRHYDELGSCDVVVSVCDRALEHGLPPHRHHLHWSIPDPALAIDPSAFATSFAEIDRRLARLLSISGTEPQGVPV
jgi:ArsR family transcriptional regulator, arsenate/arsenite/antimonite-responsive transcriptional repressor / arsenate reductase (thioredoxin)